MRMRLSDPRCAAVSAPISVTTLSNDDFLLANVEFLLKIVISY